MSVCAQCNTETRDDGDGGCCGEFCGNDCEISYYRDMAGDALSDLATLQVYARNVIDNWEHGDLAQAVNDLERQLPQVSA